MEVVAVIVLVIAIRDVELFAPVAAVLFVLVAARVVHVLVVAAQELVQLLALMIVLIHVRVLVLDVQGLVPVNV